PISSRRSSPARAAGVPPPRRRADRGRSPSPQRAARRPPTPCEHDAPVGDDLDVPARSDLLGVRELHAERAALRRLELRDPPLPPEYSTGSVNSRNTVSGDASIVIVRSMTLVSTAMPAPPLFFLLRRGLQRAKARIPEVLEIRAQLRDRLGSRPVEALRAALALGHKVRLLEDAQVLRDRRPCHVEAACDLSNRELGQRHHPQDLAASGLRNRRERVHRVKRKH